MNKSVFIVNPVMTYGDFPLPYLYLVFKSYYKEFGHHSDKWNWPLPINSVEDMNFDFIIETIVSQNPQVVAFSSYIWNSKLNLEIGKVVKAKLPNCITVYGGPEVPYDKSESWLQEHDFVDLICEPKGAGEQFMAALLDQLAEEKFDPSQIPHVIYPTADRKSIVRSKACVDRASFKFPRSMFYGNETEIALLKHMAESKGGRLSTLWETTRGCPHNCSYCDWGGSTASRVLKKEDTIVYDELRTMESLNIEYIDLCDANFGINKARDLGILQHLIDRSKQGWNFEIGLNGKTKNDLETLHKIDLLTLESKIAVKSDYHYSVNASDPVVSKAVNRWSHPTEKHVEFIKKVKDLGYKTRIEYVLGLPETTLDIFYAEYNHIAEADAWLSERYVWTLLARSPAAHPDYIKKYQIKTVPVRYSHYSTIKQRSDQTYYILNDPQYQSTYDIVISTSTYSKAEWLQMYFMDNFCRAVECIDITTHLRKICEKYGIKANSFFQLCWNSIEQMGLDKNKDLIEIFEGIENSLQGKSTFAYYSFQGKVMGMQTITSCFLVANANEFCKNMAGLLPNEKEITAAIAKMSIKLKDISDSNEPMNKIIDMHSFYVYGPDSKRLSHYSKAAPTA